MAAITAGDIIVLSRVVRLAPDNPDARYNYGVALLGDNQANAAVEQFEAALRLRPGFAEAAESLAEAREAVNR